MRRALAALAVVPALLLGACDSNESEQEYVDDLNRITDELRADVTGISKSSKAVGDPQKVADAYEDFAAEFGVAAEDAASLSPPDGIAHMHERIVEDLETMRAEALRAADDARASPAADLIHIQSRLEVDEGSLASDIDKTIDEINEELQG